MAVSVEGVAEALNAILTDDASEDVSKQSIKLSVLLAQNCCVNHRQLFNTFSTIKDNLILRLSQAPTQVYLLTALNDFLGELAEEDYRHTRKDLMPAA